MAEYINREKMLKYLEKNNTADEWIVGQYNADWIYSFIESQPTADVVEVKHGEWLPIVIQDNYLEPPYCDTIKCSECGQEADVSFHDAKYCFECGAKMDGTPKERGGEK